MLCQMLQKSTFGLGCLFSVRLNSKHIKREKNLLLRRTNSGTGQTILRRNYRWDDQSSFEVAQLNLYIVPTCNSVVLDRAIADVCFAYIEAAIGRMEKYPQQFFRREVRW